MKVNWPGFEPLVFSAWPARWTASPRTRRSSTRRSRIRSRSSRWRRTETLDMAMRHFLMVIMVFSNLLFQTGGGLCSTEEAFLLPTQQPPFQIPAMSRFFFSFLLSLCTVSRLMPSSDKQWISQTWWGPELNTTKKFLFHLALVGILLEVIYNHQLKGPKPNRSDLSSPVI